MWDQMQVFCKNIADHQIRLILHFDQELDEPILKQAAKITVENNPIGYAHYVEGDKKVSWKFSNVNMDRIYTFQESQKSGPLLQDTVLRQLDTLKGPQLTISLIRSGTDILVLNCNHAITDAAGVKDFMYELAQNYSLLSLNKSVPKQDYIPSRSLKLLSGQLGTKEKIEVLKLMLSSKRSAPTFKRTVDVNNLQNPGFKTYTFSPAHFVAMKEFGKPYGATVNDLLLAAYYFSFKKISGNFNKTNRISYSSDLRKYLGRAGYDALSNFSAIHTIDVDNSIDDFMGVLKEISTLTKVRKQVTYNLVDFPIMAVLFKTMSYPKRKGLFLKEFNKMKEGKSTSAPGISNIGIIEASRVSFDTIVPGQAYVLGGINHPSLMQLTASTYKNHLTISIGTYYSEQNELFIDNFIETLKQTVQEEMLRQPVAEA